jgi:hypothetical protein
MNRYLCLSLLCLALSFQSCTYRYTAFPTMTLAGPAIDKDNFRVNDYQLADKNIEGQDFFSIIVFFPMIGENQKITLGMVDNAVKKICAEKKLAFMTNVRIYTTGWYIPLIYGQVKFIVRGEGWTAAQKTSLIEGLEDAGYAIAQGNE